MNSNPASIQDLSIDQLKQLYSRAFNAGQYAQAFQICVEAINRDPDTDHHKLAMSTIIRQVVIQQYNPVLRNAIETCLKSAVVARQNFSQAWQALVKTAPDLQPIMSLIKVHDYTSFKEQLKTDKALTALNDPLLALGLRTLILIDADLEILMRNLRRWILLDMEEQNAPLPFLTALAEHCFLRDYVFYETADECACIEKLQQKLENGSISDSDLALFGTFRPLHSLKNVKDFKPNKELATLIEQQITNPMREQAIKDSIHVVTPIEHKTSRAVREMYEENPYPRWSSITIFPDPDTETTGEYLVAGCGTCKAMLQFAMKFPNIQITAIDLSLSSLAYGIRKAEEFGVQNVEFAQCDILDLHKLGKTFDAIDCSGVLHHMKEPVEGWKSLLSVLKPSGRMSIGLYSTRARTSIHAGWDYIQDKGYKPTPSDIREFRNDVFSMPDNDPVKPVSQRVDFYNLSQCRDLVFHIQETTYTLEEIEQILQELELKFEGFWLGNPKLEAEFHKQFPNDKNMSNLANWSALEVQYPNMFNGMFQFICTRKANSTIDNEMWNRILDGKIFTLTGKK